ncbi:hypothetical protein [Brevundimonas sp. NIBR11]|uniref:hypothetical protein n=1 Tax=Brevundimonas sp. NIBR11 TaxID=3015999 RepID=UPI0022F048B5|nr:hypothetical protein [Brevundimonas sp. NIBR11]WGM32382.1 hypothetical protein KKHFBJBL_02634 [Brevundimonas sp. NIBR11]
MTVQKYAAVLNAVTLGAALWAGVAAAQVAPPPPPVEALDASPATPAAPPGPEWWIFSRGAQRHYLIDVNSVVKTGDEATVMVARIPTDSASGDYTHTLDQFGIRCSARQSHVVLSSEASEDGVPEEPYATDEPWEPIAAQSFDDAIRQIACEDMRPEPPTFPTVKAYIDAGRP